MTETYPAFAGAGAKVRIFPPGTRTVEVTSMGADLLRSVPPNTWPPDTCGPDFMTEYVYLTPHMRGDQIVFAGYHAPSDTWYYTDD